MRLHIFKLCAAVKSRSRFLCRLTNWHQGTDRKTLKILWSMYLMGKIDYGDIIYDLASTSTKSRLDKVLRRSLLKLTGCFRSTPKLSLCVEAQTKLLQ